MNGREPRYVEIALALGAAGVSFAVAPVGNYTFPFALGAAGLALLARPVFDRESTAPLGPFSIAAIITCSLALLVAVLGFIGANRLPGELKINLEGPFVEYPDGAYGSFEE